MADPTKIVTDPDFLAASPEMKRAILMKHDPDFAAASPEMQGRIIGRFSSPPAAEPEMSPQELIARGITGSGFGTQAYGTPQTKVAEAARVVRVAPGMMVANPFASGAVSAVGETVAQAAEQGVGAREGFDPLSIAAAGAIPPFVAGAIHSARAFGRTVTRAIPSAFKAAQEGAMTAADDVAARLTPAEDAGQLFRVARGAPPKDTPRAPIAALPPVGGTSPTAFGPTGRYVASELTEREGVGRTLDAAAAFARGEPYREGAGMIVAPSQGPSVAGRVMKLGEPGAKAAATKATAETVPAGRLTAILDDLDGTIPTDPTATKLQEVRQVINKLRTVVKDGAVDLNELMRQRLDISQLISRGGAPQLRAIYGHGGEGAKGIIGALEEASAAGGTGATAARQALEVFKRDLGVTTWRELVEQATTDTRVSGRALDMTKLAKLVSKNADDLERTLGADGLKVIRDFQERFRALPPAQAYTGANLFMSLLLGAGGGVGGLLTGGTGFAVAGGAAAGFAAKELIQNWTIIGKNPAALNQVWTTLAQATRTGVTPLVAPPQPFNGPRVRQGVPPRG